MKNLFSFITLLILVHTTAEAQPHPVLDIDGNEVLRGEIYYVVPLSRPGQGAGIVPYAISNITCSYGVSQLLYGEGIPLIFTPVLSSGQLGGAIFDFTDLDISFSSSIGCGPSDVWKRGAYDKITGQYFVEIGGVRGNKGNGTIGNAFQIRTAPNDFYKFVFCPETCVSCLLKCYDVGIFYQEGVRRLAESGDTSFHIRFRKFEPELELARY